MQLVERRRRAFRRHATIVADPFLEPLAIRTAVGAFFQATMFARRTAWPLNPNRLSLEIEERRRQRLPILDLTESNPTRCGFEAAEILEALRQPASLNYEPEPRGLLSARIAVASYYADRGIQVEPQQIFLTTSTSEAYAFVFRLLADPGDSVLVPRPSYPLFDFIARLNDVELVSYPLVYDHSWTIDAEALGRCLTPRARAILTVHPNNPTGSFVRQSESRFLTACAQEHSLALVSDEVFSDYAFDPKELAALGEEDRPMKSLAEVSQTLTFALSGLSKISALPQMKLAWIVVNGPGNFLKTASEKLEIIADTYLSVSTPIALALPAWLEFRRVIQPQILDRIRSNLHSLRSRLTKSSPVTALTSQGGWYTVLRLPSTRTDEDWALEFLRQDGVLVHPGHFYDFTSEGHLVLSLLPPTEVFEEGVRRILDRVARCL